MLEFKSRTEMPPVAHGSRGEGVEQVTIQSNGAIRLSSKIAKQLNGNTLVATHLDPNTGKVTLGIFGKPHQKTWTEANYFKLTKAKGDKESGASFAATQMFMDAAKSGFTYDYKASGTQVFPAKTAKSKDGNGVYVEFTLPKGSLTPRAFIARKKKVADTIPPAGPQAEQIAA